jgi:hypothetical protein
LIILGEKATVASVATVARVTGWTRLVGKLAMISKRVANFKMMFLIGKTRKLAKLAKLAGYLTRPSR